MWNQAILKLAIRITTGQYLEKSSIRDVRVSYQVVNPERLHVLLFDGLLHLGQLISRTERFSLTTIEISTLGSTNVFQLDSLRVVVPSEAMSSYRLL